MNGIAWSKLLRAGLRDLGLAPPEFWALTPAELMLMLGEGNGVAPLGRTRFEELSRTYPDIRYRKET